MTKIVIRRVYFTTIKLNRVEEIGRINFRSEKLTLARNTIRYSADLVQILYNAANDNVGRTK